MFININKGVIIFQFFLFFIYGASISIIQHVSISGGFCFQCFQNTFSSRQQSL
jgi:hypothetical protein